MAMILTLIWQAVLKVWAVQNAHLQTCNHKQEDCSQLCAAVNQMMYEASQDPLLHTMVKQHQSRTTFGPTKMLDQTMG